MGVLRRLAARTLRHDLPRAGVLSRRPRPGRSATSCPAAAERRQRIGTAITSTRRASRSCGRTATQRDVPSDMISDDRPPWPRSAVAWRHATATPRCSRAACTSPMVTRSTGPTATKGIFMYTFEMYPSHTVGEHDRPVLPGRRAHRAADRPNKEANPDPHRGRCLSRTTSSASPPLNCGPLYDTFEITGGWTTNPLGTDTAHELPAAGSGRTRRPPTARPARSRQGRAPWSPVTSPAPTPTATTWTGVNDGPFSGHRPAGDDRFADLPLLLRAQLEFVGRGLLPRLRRDRRRPPHPGQAGASGQRTPISPTWSSASVSMAPWPCQTVRIVFRSRGCGTHQDGRGGRR